MGKRNFAFKSLRTKLLVWTSGCLVLSLAVVIYCGLQKNRQLAMDKAAQDLRRIAAKHEDLVRDRLQLALNCTQTLAESLATVQQAGATTTTPLTREAVVAMLRGVVQAHPSFIGVSTCWEPNAFDGKDAQYVNAPGHDATGRFIPYVNHAADGSCVVDPLVDYENTTKDAQGLRVGEWYLKPRETKTSCLTDPFEYVVQGKSTLMVTLATPILAGGRFLGVVTVDLPVNFIQKQLDDVGMAGLSLNVVGAAGKLVGVTGKPELVGKGLETTNADAAEDLADIKAGKESIDQDGDAIEALLPMQFEGINGNWGIIAKLNTQMMMVEAHKVVWMQLAIALGCLTLGVALIWILAGKIVRPIRQTVDTLKDIAQGEGDLTRRVELLTEDEVGQLGQWFNIFMERIQGIIRDVAATAQEVAGAAHEIAASSEEIAAGMQRQSEQTTQVSAAVEEMEATVLEVVRQAEAATEDASQNGEQARAGGSVVRETISSINAIAGLVNESAKSIGELGQRSEQIGEIINVIKDIADQTNLLALNAAIEAARAGEHGRGFAVVADEVRKLAERTTHATKEVSESILAIQRETSTAVEQMGQGTRSVGSGVALAEQAGGTLETIVAGAQNVGAVVHTIATAIEQQSTAMTGIAQSIESINSVTRQGTEGAAQAAAAAAQLSVKSQQLQTLVDQFKF
jgi:methyl-accepting chemotaxis protein